MWLTGRLMPDFKTIANFRKDNCKAIRGVCRQFVVLCQQLGLFSENLMAIDGSKFKAVNNRDRNFTSAKLKRRMEEIESSINRYLTSLDAADRQVPSAAEPDAKRMEEKISKLKAQMKELQVIESQLNDSQDKQVSLTAPRCPLDDDAWQRHRRLQRTDGCRYTAPFDRCSRGHERWL